MYIFVAHIELEGPGLLSQFSGLTGAFIVKALY